MVREAIFEELCRSLNLGIEHCVVSALDGLGHLKHPGVRRVIDELLGDHPGIRPTVRKYALECREGRNEWCINPPSLARFGNGRRGQKKVEP